VNGIPAGFTPNAKNFRIKEYGGIEKILGYSAFADLGSGVDGHDLFYFQKKDASSKQLVCASSTKWQSISSSGTVADIRTGMNASLDTTFVMYEDVMYGLDPANDGAYWTGTSTATSMTPGVSTGPPRGIILGIWQNKMWVAKATAGVLGMRVEWSAVAASSNPFRSTDQWPAANFVELGGAGGSSDRIIGGMPTSDGLVVFTTGSTFIIYDATTGANNVIDAEHGCSSRRSLARVDDMIYGVNAEGVFKTDGRFPLQIVSRKIDPLFVNESPTLSGAAGVWWFNSYLASYQRTAAYNDLTLDYFPGGESFMANDYRAKCWAFGPLASVQERLYFIDAGNTRYIRRAFDGGAFLTTASPGVASNIACHYEIPFNSFGNEFSIKRLHSIRAVGRGDLYVGVFVDYEANTDDTERLGFTAIPGGVWDTMLWGTGLWGGYSLFEGHARLQAKGRVFSFRITESSQSTYASRDALGSSPSGSIGGAGLYQIEPRFNFSSKNR
jgi:hypothetical protein